MGRTGDAARTSVKVRNDSTDNDAVTGARSIRGTQDGGFIVLGGLVKVALILAVLAVPLHDAISIASTQVRLAEDARAVAQSGRDALDATSGTPAKAAAAARRNALVRGYPATAADITVTGSTITVRLHETASTLIAGRLPVARNWVLITAEGRARSLARSP